MTAPDPLSRDPLRYLSGEEILVGDCVRIADHNGVVLAVFRPGTKEGRDWSCPNGGFLVDDERIGLCTWKTPDEDLELVSHAPLRPAAEPLRQ